MFRLAAPVVLLVSGCGIAKPPTPPVPCPVIEPVPCNAITPEQQKVLDAVAEILKVPLVEQSAALCVLAEERDAAVSNVGKLRKELKEKVLEACRRTNTELQARVDQLEADLEELKQLTIEMERKAK